MEQMIRCNLKDGREVCIKIDKSTKEPIVTLSNTDGIKESVLMSMTQEDFDTINKLIEEELQK